MSASQSPRSSRESTSLASIEPLLVEESSECGFSEVYSEKTSFEHRPEDCFDFLFFDNVVSRSLYFIWTYLRPILLFLVPSFLRRYLSIVEDTNEAAPNLHAIACLDGIRGFASLGVFILHFTDTYCSHRVNYGFGVDDGNRWWFQLPFIRLFWTGNSMVACFFALSGYVLSHKPLKQMRSRSDASLLQTLGSAVFRRGLRLFLPCIAATFIAMLLVRIGAFEHGHEVFINGHFMTATEDTPPYLSTFGEQLSHWLQSMKDMTYPWHFGSVQTIYDPHLWTIPMEFQGSMVLYLVILCVSNLRTFVRMAIVSLVIAYCLYTNMLDFMMFFIGMFLAEIDLIFGLDSSQPLSLFPESGFPPRRHSSRWRKFRRFLLYASFLAGLYLMSTPVWSASTTPGYRTLIRILTSEWYAQKLGCILLIVSVRHSPLLGTLFTNGLAQYLGRVSFALYIVHGNVRRIVLYAMMPWIWETVGGKESVGGSGTIQGREALGTMGMINAREIMHGSESQWQFGMSVAIGIAAIWPITFLCADLFMRGVDAPSVRFSRWLEGRFRRV